MRTLLIDNYDSYTYNLAELIARVTGSPPVVRKNDEISCGAALRLPVDCIVLSPGPGSPEHARDVGICDQLLSSASVPVLGVCLGHQIIAHHWGARVSRAEHPAHGTVSKVALDGGEPLFRGMPGTIEVVRYHSLAVTGALPASLLRIATADDGTIMAVRHAGRPQWGVQFHPEAACTEYGEQLMRNFRDLAGGRSRGLVASREPRPVSASPRQPDASPRQPDPVRLELVEREVRCRADPLRIFESLYAHRDRSFWLDSNALRPSHRWSFMGALDGPLDHMVTATGNTITMTGRDAHGATAQAGSPWGYLRRELARYAIEGTSRSPVKGGYVGYLGYGLDTAEITVARSRRQIPDLALLFCTRLLAIDHAEERVIVQTACRPGERADAEEWLTRMCAALAALAPFASALAKPRPVADPAAVAGILTATALSTQEQYEEKIRACIEKIADGESYEICLTTGFEGAALRDPFAVYRILRSVNPAPYSAYLNFGSVQVLSSSPERFLRVSPDRRAETRPIKGTSPRLDDPAADAVAAAELAADPKMRSENMMIVDLLRNDLNRVCGVGTVAVDSLMHVESYQTVHQLVSTISGRISAEHTPVDLVESCFPGGSMTGAPKLRTMELISELEQHARGVYAGALGVLSLDGYIDLSIVIRTIVNDPGRWFIGAGGAVLIGSDPALEYQEMICKATPPATAVLLAGEAGQL